MNSPPAGGMPLVRPDVLPWLRLARVYHKMLRGATEQLRPWGLSGAQFDVLAHVGTAEGRTQQELADALLTTKGNVCQLLDRMEAGGLLCRVQDGRVNRLRLTARGRQVYAEVVPAHEAWVAERLAVLSPAERDVLASALRRLDRSLP